MYNPTDPPTPPKNQPGDSSRGIIGPSSFDALTPNVGRNGTLFADIINDIHEKTLAPLPLCIQGALGVGALAVQSSLEVEWPDKENLPTSLILIGFGESGEGKSLVIDAFMRPVTDFLDEHEAACAEANEKYIQDEEVRKKTHSYLVSGLAQEKAKEAVFRANESFAGLVPDDLHKNIKKLNNAIEYHRQNRPTPPPSVGLGILSDTTPQAIPKFIKKERIYSLGIITPEGEEILTNGIKHKSSMLNKGFSGEATQRIRVGEGDQSHTAPMTVLIFVQPEIAKEAFGKSKAKMRSTGFLARCLFSFPPTTRGLKTLKIPHKSPAEVSISAFSKPLPEELSSPTLPNNFSPQPEPVRDRYNRWVTDKLAQIKDAPSKKKHSLKLSTEARLTWSHYFVESQKSIGPNGRYSAFPDHGSRLPEQALRVAAIIHAYNTGMEGEISEETISLAISLVNYFSEEFLRLFTPLSKESEDIYKLQNWFDEKRQQGIRYLPRKKITANGPLRPASLMEVALHALMQRQEINIGTLPRYNRHGRATRPCTFVDLNPHLPRNEWELNQAIQETYELDSI